MGKEVSRPLVEGVGERPTTQKPLPPGVVRAPDGSYVKRSMGGQPPTSSKPAPPPPKK